MHTDWFSSVEINLKGKCNGVFQGILNKRHKQETQQTGPFNFKLHGSEPKRRFPPRKPGWLLGGHLLFLSRKATPQDSLGSPSCISYRVSRRWALLECFSLGADDHVSFSLWLQTHTRFQILAGTPVPNCSLREGIAKASSGWQRRRQESCIKAVCKVTQLVMEKYIFILVLTICIPQKPRGFWNATTETL